MIMKTRKAATLILTLTFLLTNAGGAFSQQTPSSTPTPTAAQTDATTADDDQKLIEALERCQNETNQSRIRIDLLEKREKALEKQIEVEKENGRRAGAVYLTAVKEIEEVRAALKAAKKELKLREQREKELKKQIKKLKGELWLTRFAAAGIIGFLVYLLAKN